MKFFTPKGRWIKLVLDQWWRFTIIHKWVTAAESETIRCIDTETAFKGSACVSCSLLCYLPLWSLEIYVKFSFCAMKSLFVFRQISWSHMRLCHMNTIGIIKSLCGLMCQDCLKQYGMKIQISCPRIVFKNSSGLFHFQAVKENCQNFVWQIIWQISHWHFLCLSHKKSI